MVRPGEPPMAKEQKTVMVPEELYALCSWVEKNTGAPFTRQVIAGLLRYLLDCEMACPPDPYWMAAAVQLERGEITVAQLALDAKRAHLQQFERERNILQHRKASGQEVPERREQWAEFMYEDAKRLLDSMTAKFEDPENPTVDEILKNWSQWRKMLPSQD